MPNHSDRYVELTDKYVLARGQQPDRNWRAFLWIATAMPNLWPNHVAPFVNMAEGTVDFDRLLEVPLSSGERRLMQAARSLYADHGDVDLSDLASLDTELWEAVIGAVALYRGAKQIPSRLGPGA